MLQLKRCGIAAFCFANQMYAGNCTLTTVAMTSSHQLQWQPNNNYCYYNTIITVIVCHCLLIFSHNEHLSYIPQCGTYIQQCGIYIQQCGI